MLLFTVGAGKKPGNSGDRSAAPTQQAWFLNGNLLLLSLIK
jgi:hypothetical protein